MNASGSMATDLYDSYFPVENDYGSLNSLYEPRTDNVEVYDDHLRVWPTETSAKRQFLIEPFKHIISFTEISYALSERIHKWETKRFTTAVKKTEFPKMPDSFDRVCNLRGSITHNQQNSLNFKVSAQNKLQLGKRDVEDFFEGTLVDLANWIDTIYYKMYQALVSLD